MNLDRVIMIAGGIMLAVVVFTAIMFGLAHLGKLMFG